MNIIVYNSIKILCLILQLRSKESACRAGDTVIPGQVEVKVKVAQACPTFSDPMGYSLWNSLGQNTGVSSLSLLQGISQPRNRTQVSHIAAGFFTSWVTREAVQETRVQFLGWEDLLEKGIATHSSILAWRIPQTEEPGRLQSIGLQRVRHDWATNTFTFIATIKPKNWT